MFLKWRFYDVWCGWGLSCILDYLVLCWFGMIWGYVNSFSWCWLLVVSQVVAFVSVATMYFSPYRPALSHLKLTSSSQNQFISPAFHLQIRISLKHKGSLYITKPQQKKGITIYYKEKSFKKKPTNLLPKKWGSQLSGFQNLLFPNPSGWKRHRGIFLQNFLKLEEFLSKSPRHRNEDGKLLSNWIYWEVKGDRCIVKKTISIMMITKLIVNVRHWYI